MHLKEQLTLRSLGQRAESLLLSDNYKDNQGSLPRGRVMGDPKFGD